jgi:lipopolysaccharide biosynthesis regulator YciM
MPYFERGNNCSNAYHEIRSFEKMLYQSETIAIYSSIKSCLALKMGEYDLAVKHLREIEEQWQDVYQDRVLRGTLTQEYVTKKEKDFKKLQEKIKHISERDMDYISDFIRTKEQNSLKNLGLNKI